LAAAPPLVIVILLALPPEPGEATAEAPPHGRAPGYR
jgi:hypothetical protein